MKYALMFSLLVFTLPCSAQTPQTEKAQTSGPCSPAITGGNNQIRITCQGLTKEQGAKMVNILNTILANQLDPKVVMSKLDEILHAVNPNLLVKTYFCDGTYRQTGPAANVGFLVNVAGDDKAFQEMVALNNTQKWDDLLKDCLVQIESAPEWLTSRLFCGLAYQGLGNKVKAKEMLTEFDSRTGPSYSVDGCKQMSDHLHATLQ
ncbi:MAG: hypothetical protein ABSF40_11825 [Candidatus Acidiferrales bacterium]|jgi:hypothetical protein